MVKELKKLKRILAQLKSLLSRGNKMNVDVTKLTTRELKHIAVIRGVEEVDVKRLGREAVLTILNDLPAAEVDPMPTAFAPETGVPETCNDVITEEGFSEDEIKFDS